MSTFKEFPPSLDINEPQALRKRSPNTINLELQHAHSLFTIKELPPTLDINELAVLLKRSASTINKDLHRAPSRVPPPSPAHNAGARRIWITAQVLTWLAGSPSKEPKQRGKRGHPGKAALVRRMQSEGGQL